MADLNFPDEGNFEATAVEAAGSSVVEGELTPAVRVVRLVIAAAVLGSLAAGVWEAASSSAHGRAALVNGLFVSQIVLAAVLILLGSLVEGFGFGLSLGTHWPYTRNIFVLLVTGDPEAAHRVVATLVGLIAVALVILAPGSATVNGLALVVLTALLGVGTLHVLSGRIPSFVHGTHGLLAYGVFLSYLAGFLFHGVEFWSYLGAMWALHPVLVTVFLGGMTTGQRGFGKPIGAFYMPERAAHWVVALHIVSALSLVAALGWLMPVFPVAFFGAIAQIAVGFLLFHAVNLKPANPGTIVAFHQCMVLFITVAVVAALR